MENDFGCEESGEVISAVEIDVLSRARASGFLLL